LRNKGASRHKRLGPCAWIILIGVCQVFAQDFLPPARVQTQQPGPAPGNSSGPAPVVLTYRDALARAQRYEPQFAAAVNAENLAHEDTVQARAALYPAFGARSDYLNTQGNGKLPSGRFVTNDGVHVYRDWATFHQDLSPGTLSRIGVQRAAALEAAARARVEIARRGLVVTVTKAYYGLVNAQRKYATAQLGRDQAQHFLGITQDLERGGEVAHSDVGKAQIQYNSQEQALREAKLAMDTARLDLAVLLSPDLNQNFQVVDDLHLTSALPPFPDIQTLAQRQNPDLRVAMENLRSARMDITIARQAFLPTVTVDLVWGIEANQIGWNTVVASDPRLGPVPSAGYFLTGSLTLPLWDWGARKSKLRQAELKREQANVELSAAQRLLLRNLSGYFEEAEAARSELDLLRQSADLATENLRANGLRYRAGEATILELVDAENTLNQARNAYDDGLVRYRLALANLQTLTGPF
jgi:outer membrane protein TolC